MRIGNLQRMLRYAQAVRTSVAASGDFPLEDEIPLPGLAHAQSQVAVPMLAHDTLVGVIARDG